MSELVYFVGIPASGKSTYAKELKGKGYNIHSSDSIREELYGDENTQGDPKEIFGILHKRVIEDLKSGKNCVYDATGISTKRRMAFLNTISHIDCKKICLLFATPYEVCLERNKNRERKVPEEVIKRMYMNFNIPYFYEGWDEIKIIWSEFDKTKYNYQSYPSIYDSYDQHNSHHELSLGMHMRMATTFSTIYDSMYVEEAASLHDIGKPFTATFFDSKGNPSSDCHYYNHENVSAYDSLFILKDSNDYFVGDAERYFCDNDILYTCSLINLHMKPYTWKEEKTKEKYKKLLGEEMYNDLMDLHLCDVNAH